MERERWLYFGVGWYPEYLLDPDSSSDERIPHYIWDLEVGPLDSKMTTIIPVSEFRKRML